VEAAGIEPLADFPEKQPTSRASGAESGALCERAESSLPTANEINVDLAAVIQAWPQLPAPIRAGILALVRAAS
jgi:hypothetical protein